MAGVREATESFLSEYPGAEEDLKTVLEIDQDGVWDFEDIPFDSGLFGELVSRGVAEQSGNGYCLADRSEVKAALGGDSQRIDEKKSHNGSLATTLRYRVEVNAHSMGALCGSLLLLVAFRIFSYGSVFREKGVVLLNNDPYYYRYWVEFLLTQSNGVVNGAVLSTLPDAVA